MHIIHKKFKRIHYPSEIILLCFRWYLSYSLSLRDLEEIMLERGIKVDHSTIHRWVLRLTSEFSKRTRKHKTRTNTSWRMDETYIKVKGKWCYLYRALDKYGDTVDFYFSKTRNTRAAELFFTKAIIHNGYPNKVNLDKNQSNLNAINNINSFKHILHHIEISRQKYLNNIIESSHRFIKKRCKAMLWFKSFKSADIILEGIESIQMIKKFQIRVNKELLNPLDTFYKLVA